MSSKWQRVVQEKLFLAENLLRQAVSGTGGNSAGPGRLEQIALVQGAVALMLTSREALLVLIAQLNQHRVKEVGSLNGLAELLGDENPDVMMLRGLSQGRTGWWSELDMLAGWLRQPRESSQAPGEQEHSTNLITAVVVEGPDTAPEDLLALTAEMKRYVAQLCRLQDEW